tara:strand:+ start:1990 stop:2424 length:435 start_codon:yes stop_codon:yes gene_type:complete
MKKWLIAIMMVIACYATVGNADVKQKKVVTLNFTMTYKQDTIDKPIEHVMKNKYVITNYKWVTVGKFNANDDSETILLLVRMMSHKDNKFKLQFMLIDSSNDHTYVSQPQMHVISGLPAQLKQRDGDRSVQLDVLMNLATQPES